MTLAVLDDPVDFDGWRRAARSFVLAGEPPDRIVWQVRDQPNGGDLFAAEAATEAAAPATAAASAQFSVPRAFVDLAGQAILHSDAERFALLYRILWRLRADRNLIDDASDPDIHAVRAFAKSVARDIHKMHAFVRFKEVVLDAEAGSAYLAWFEPDHHIVEAAAPFFVRRFTGMRWSILTPRRSAVWDGTCLAFLPGADRRDVPDEDRLEAHWRTYYASIFNPARLKIDAMTREMPKKYWKNLPEAAMIPSLIKEAGGRADAMIAAAPTAPSRIAVARARQAPPPAPDEIDAGEKPSSLEAARAAAAACRRCDLYRPATQTVFGVGTGVSGLMFVGEQPGDKEDLAGRPFVGPAGQMFDKALGEAAIDRSTVYVTNAVKHFKYEPRGKFRLHKKPNGGEIATCRWWLDLERAFIQPKLIVALGASAAQSILDRPVTIGRERARPVRLADGATLWITVHPSYLLRLPDDARPAEYGRFVQDLLGAKAFLAAA